MALYQKSDGVVQYFGDSSEITLTHEHNVGLILEGNAVSGCPVFTLKNTNADATGGTLKFLKDGSSVGDADVIGNITFVSEDDGDAAHTYAKIVAKVDDMTGGQEEGSLEFHVAEYDGTLTKGLDIVGLGSDGNVTVDITTHDGAAGGLKLGGTLVTSTAAELNILDGLNRGHVIVGDSNNAPASLAQGSENQVLTIDGSGDAVWADAQGGTATAVTVADESSDTTCFPLFATAASGDLGPKSGSNLTFNSSSGLLTATGFSGNLTGTLQTAAQANVTSLGTLTALTVSGATALNGNVTLGDATGDDITVNGSVASHVLPKTNTTHDLGSTTYRWADIYTGDLHLANKRGNWTVVEEEDILTIRNNLTGKWYQLGMTEIDPVGRDEGMNKPPVPLP